jgi:VTC domain-containing protein
MWNSEKPWYSCGILDMKIALRENQSEGDRSVSSPLPAAAFESPSLSAKCAGAGPAFELKFLLTETQARQIEDWARRHLALDPHGDPALGGAYQTTSLYCDTPQLDVYHRAPSYKRRKFRVRRYGDSDWTFFERKSKWGDRVAKKRVAIPDEELVHLTRPMSLIDWPGHWFHRSLNMRRLQPACLIAYHRLAYFGSCPESPLRLTLDRRVRGILSSDWRIVPFDAGLPLLTDQVIVELKFRTALPTPFKALVHDLHLTPGAVSKYRRCREAWGVPPAHREAANA